MPGRMCYVSQKEKGVVVLYLVVCVRCYRERRGCSGVIPGSLC